MGWILPVSRAETVSAGVWWGKWEKNRFCWMAKRVGAETSERLGGLRGAEGPADEAGF